MPISHDANGNAGPDDRGQAMDKTATPTSGGSTRPGRAADGKGQSDTGRADQTDDKAASSDEAAHDAFDPDEEQT